MPAPASEPVAELLGSRLMVPCIDGVDRVAVELDQAASTQALPTAAQRVTEFLPWYSSVHRGAGVRSRRATAAYEDARRAVLTFAGRPPDDGDDVAILCRNTTEAVNHLAYRLRLEPSDIVATTVVEHHANLLPWGRACQRRYVECSTAGTFTVDDVIAVLDQRPTPVLLAITGASNVTGWLPPIEEIIEAAHHRGVPVMVDAAQLAPHRPLPPNADYLAFSGHKLYAPFGSGALIGPRSTFETGDPFLAGGGAVDLVGLDEVVWTAPPDREEAGSPNVIGAVAMHASIDELATIGWDRIRHHEQALSLRLRGGLEELPGVHLLGPQPGDGSETLPVAAFTVRGMHHALVAARLSAEYGIAVRHGCFCAHPYVVRLLGMGDDAIDSYRNEVLRGDHRRMPGAVRASAGIGTSGSDIDRLLAAVSDLAGGAPAPVPYEQDEPTGDFFPVTDQPGWRHAARELGASCARG